ncbi:MAG: DMT family transporter [Ruminococcaceae bacterium]|nr:DMT family transporter [Oscillospiraceae bacterium]
MQYYLLVLAATLLLAVDFSLNKVYQKRAGVSPAASFGFNAILGLFTAIVFFVINGFRFEFTTFSAIMAVAMAVTNLLYSVIGLKMLSAGKMAIYTLFLMTGGMTLPYIWGLLFWDEPFSVLRTIGIILILGGVVCSNISGGKSEKKSNKYVILGVLVFVLNGCVSIFSKAHQIEEKFVTVSSQGFIILSGLAKFIFCAVVLLFLFKKDENSVKALPFKRIVLIIAGSALIGGVSYLFQLVGAENLPATVLYPLVTGGSIVFSTLAGWILFREKPNARIWIGVALCVAGTFFFL